MNMLRPVILRNSMRIPMIFYASNFAFNKNLISCQRSIQAYSTTTTLGTSSNDSLFVKMINKFKNSKSKLRASSCLLYESIADGVNYMEFFSEFGLKDTFNSWFLVTELHVWLLCLRVMAEGSESKEDGRFMRNCLVEAMWADVQARSKKLGASNPSLTREQITVLSEQFQASLISYDEGISFDDRALASALWRRFFESECNDFTKLEKLIKYTRKTAYLLDNMSRRQLLSDPKIQWLPIND